MNWNTNFEIELHETGYIGVWYSMLAFQGKEIEKALFVSPILDMKKFIELMPQREDAYYKWVINHPITHWDASTPKRGLQEGERSAGCVLDYPLHIA